MEIFFRADWFSKGQGRAGTGECLLKIALFYEEGDLKEKLALQQKDKSHLKAH